MQPEEPMTLPSSDIEVGRTARLVAEAMKRAAQPVQTETSMYVDEQEYVVDIYPFVATREDAAFKRRITVSKVNHLIFWDGIPFASSEAADYITKLANAFKKAFEIVDGLNDQPVTPHELIF